MGSTDLEGLCAVVTGSTSGIGLGIATKLASAGANVVLNGFAENELIQKITDQLLNANEKVRFEVNLLEVSWSRLT